MHWNNIESIVESLEDLYGNEDIPENDLPYLHEMVLSIPEFEDSEVEVEEDHLKVILEAWIDFRNENK